MSMLIRGERQVALNNLIEKCKEEADLYGEAAELADDPALAEMFINAGREREEMAIELAAYLRRLGDLPAAPDRDRETLEELTTRVKTVFSADKRLMLLDNRLRAEKGLSSLIAVALGEKMPPHIHSFLSTMQRQVTATTDELWVARRKAEPGSG